MIRASCRRPMCAHVVPWTLTCPVGDGQHAADDAQQRGLSAAVGPDQAQELAGRNVEASRRAARAARCSRQRCFGRKSCHTLAHKGLSPSQQKEKERPAEEGRNDADRYLQRGDDGSGETVGQDQEGRAGQGRGRHQSPMIRPDGQTHANGARSGPQNRSVRRRPPWPRSSARPPGGIASWSARRAGPSGRPPRRRASSGSNRVPATALTTSPAATTTPTTRSNCQSNTWRLPNSHQTTLCRSSDGATETRNINRLPSTALTIVPERSNVWTGTAPTPVSAKA